MTSGILGDRYISLQPGGDDKLLAPGDQITFVESAVILERLIGKMIHNTDVSNGGGNGNGNGNGKSKGTDSGQQ